jgi:hypothetical protein
MTTFTSFDSSGGKSKVRTNERTVLRQKTASALLFQFIAELFCLNVLLFSSSDVVTDGEKLFDVCRARDVCFREQQGTAAFHTTFLAGSIECRAETKVRSE